MFDYFRPKIVMVLIGLSQEPMTVVCEKLSDMEDYFQPHSPGTAYTRVVYVPFNATSKGMK